MQIARDGAMLFWKTFWVLQTCWIWTGKLIHVLKVEKILLLTGTTILFGPKNSDLLYWSFDKIQIETFPIHKMLYGQISKVNLAHKNSFECLIVCSIAFCWMDRPFCSRADIIRLFSCLVDSTVLQILQFCTNTEKPSASLIGFQLKSWPTFYALLSGWLHRSWW